MNDERTERAQVEVPSAIDVARQAAMEGTGVWIKSFHPIECVQVCSCDDTFPVGGGCPVHPGAKEPDWRRKAHDLHERWSGYARISAVVPWCPIGPDGIPRYPDPETLEVATPDTP